MLESCRAINRCRLCDKSVLDDIITLSPTPPANNLITKEQLGKQVERFPLVVCRCDACQHLQLRYIVDPKLMFSTYLYVSGTSPVMRQHLADQADQLAERTRNAKNKFVVEIGSNDGSLLQNFQRHGFRVLGIDPAKNVAEQANKAGVPTIADFFNESLGKKLSHEYGKAGLVCANHCFAHIDDLHSVVEGVKHLLDEGAEFVFEVGYLLDVYQKVLFDTIYHEHLDYHHVEPLVHFFDRHGMSLVRVERHNIQGGALRGFVRLGKVKADSSVGELIEGEHKAGLHRKETFVRYMESIQALSTNLRQLLESIAAKGARLYGFGVPAKATTLLYNFHVTKKDIPLIVDDNPMKHNRYIAGLEIPIVSPDVLHADKPEYCLILAWNFADSIMERNQSYMRDGGTFIVPLPVLKLVNKDGTKTWNGAL
jgi:SAM-dependent methyltransferase